MVQLISKGLAKLSFEFVKGLGIGKVVYGTGVNFGHPTVEIYHPLHRTHLHLSFPLHRTQNPHHPLPPSIKVNKDPLFINGHEGGGGRDINWINTGRNLRREREVVLVIQRVTGKRGAEENEVQ